MLCFGPRRGETGRPPQTTAKPLTTSMRVWPMPMAAKSLRRKSEPLQLAARGPTSIAASRPIAHSGISLDEQRRKIEVRCVEMGWHLDHVFVDAGVSGGNGETTAGGEAARHRAAS